MTYATYADNSTEAIHGQHMRPMILPMEIVRFPDFVLEEWTLRLQDYAPFVSLRALPSSIARLFTLSFGVCCFALAVADLTIEVFRKAVSCHVGVEPRLLRGHGREKVE